MFNPTYKANKGQKAMDMILSVVCMIITNRVPKGVVTFNTANITNKVRMVNAPRGVELVTRTEIPKGSDEAVTIEKNTNERAVVRILVPTRTMTLSEVNAEQHHDEHEEPSSPKGTEDPKSPAPDATPEKNDDAASAASPSNANAKPASGLSRIPSERIIEQD